MTDPTNADRAARALKALFAYKGAESGAAGSQENISDFLADLHHLLDTQKQIDPAQLLDSWLSAAHGHYENEREKAVTRYRFSYSVVHQYQAEIDVPGDIPETKIEDYIRTHKMEWEGEKRVCGSEDVEIITDSLEKV